MALSLFTALAITWVPAWFVLHRMVPGGAPGRSSLVLGYSLLFGFIGISLAMRLLSLLGIPFSMAAVGLSMLPLFVLGLVIPRGREVVRPGGVRGTSGPAQALLLLCGLLIAAHGVMLAIEVLTTPVSSWDSKQHWAKQAKVFLAHREVVPHVTNLQWLIRGGEGVYTNLHPDYPVTLPLIQAWVGVALGGWHDVYINLPWLLCFGAIGLVFYGQLRVAGVDVAVAAAATYMVLSLPLLNAQVALAGYADPFMALAFLGAFAAFLNWTRERQAWQGILALLCVSSCVLLKQEGIYWALAFLPGLLVLYVGPGRGYAVLCALLLVMVLLLMLLPPGTSFAGHTIREMHFFYRPAGWLPLLEGFFLHDNWHLTSYLFGAALIGYLVTGWRGRYNLAPALTVLAGVAFLILLLYLFTGYTVAAVKHTSSNRLAMHFVPAWLFMLTVLFCHMRRPVTRDTETGLRD